MSHFSVMVVTNSRPSDDELSAIMLPWHEFECTGLNNEYVIDVDKTDEVRSGMTKGETLESALADYGLEDHIVADESEVDRSGPHKFGFAIVRDGELIRAVDRTNPNKRWDWWVVGGRWHGFFKLKPGAVGVAGKPSFMTRAAEPGHADQAQVSAIDFAAMREASGRKAGEDWDLVRSVIGLDATWQAWPEIRTEHAPDIKAAREAYHAQPALAALHEAGKTDPRLAWIEADPFRVSRAEYVASAERRAGQTLAIVKDGKWHERGEMGWFGIVHDEQDPEAWSREFATMIDGLPADAWLTAVDCHI